MASALQDEAAGIDWDGKVVFVRGTRPFYVELIATNVDTVIHYCREAMQRSADKGPPRLKKDATPALVDEVPCAASSSAAGSNSTCSSRSLAQAAAFSMPISACPLVPNKITWHPSVAAWAVHYKNSAGEKVQKRIRVTFDKEAGKDKSKWEAARCSAYVRALHFWNAEDRSTRDRIEVPTAM